MNKNKGFYIELCSDIDIDGMSIDICFNNNRVATLNYAKGIQHSEIDVFIPPKKEGRWSFSLGEFMSTLEEAKNIMKKCYEEDKRDKR
jgi:hypothetical protein